MNPQDQNPQPEQGPAVPPTPTPQPEITPDPVAEPTAPVATSTQPAPVSADPAAPAPTKKPFPKKLVIIISAVVGGLAILGVGAWLLLSVILNASFALKTFDGDGYSIQVPVAYEQTSTSTSESFFEADDSLSESEKSGIIISRQEYGGASKDLMKDTLKEVLTDEGMSSVDSSGTTVKNLVSTDTTLGGGEALIAKFDYYKADTKYAIGRVAYVFTDDEVYLISVAGRYGAPGISANADRILNSFKLK